LLVGQPFWGKERNKKKGSMLVEGDRDVGFRIAKGEKRGVCQKMERGPTKRNQKNKGKGNKGGGLGGQIQKKKRGRGTEKGCWWEKRFLFFFWGGGGGGFGGLGGWFLGFFLLGFGFVGFVLFVGGCLGVCWFFVLGFFGVWWFCCFVVWGGGFLFWGWWGCFLVKTNRK